MVQKKFLAVVGATASGKSALALRLAKHFDGEIVSCDSMQIYRTMDVGTAKPTPEEMREVKHHMIDIADPDCEFSAGDYADMAGKVIDGIIERGKKPIMCGGTFLYLDSLTAVSSLSDAGKDEKLRRRLEEYAAENGRTALHEMLRKIDPDSADAIHENNVKRVIRAIEIYEMTGKTKSEWDSLSKEAKAPYNADIIMIDYHNRDILYDRINRRVDMMMEKGLEKEARELYEKGYLEGKYCAAQAIGYKEFKDYFEGRATLDATVSLIKQLSRNYAKRQLTWMRRYGEAMRIRGDCEDGTPRSADEIFSDAVGILEREGICFDK